ncbi:helix-turn-helix domain-containing protein [Paenibacillus sp. Leaf72]|uniref:RNA-guided endonuclease InsQ/TnpB family protein n=1 Tax=Paenibacillus sp. Leaf72 TaxID=1736234 RepID=UPI000AD6DC36
MLKAYKYRIYPNREQQLYLAKTFGSVRFIYNRMLADKINHYKETETMLKNTPAPYKKKFDWLKEVDSLALANAQLNLDKAYKNFFRDPKAGFPKYKSKKTNNNSYTTNNQKGTISAQDGFLRIPKLKSKIRIKLHRPFTGRIKSCTLSKTPSLEQ